MNLAVHDALLLSRALVAFYASGRMDLLDGYPRPPCAGSGARSTSRGG